MHDKLPKQNSLSSQTPLILFATPPPLEQLRALTIHIPSTAHSVSRFQPQVIKCREFIFTEPDVIGTPSVNINDHSFHLIGKVQLIKSGKLQTRLARIGLWVSDAYEVSPQLYQSCLRYTLTARLSPNWNKVGPWLVQGRDFLTMKGCANAVKIDVSVNQNELFFTLEASAVKLSPLLVTDLDILGKHLEHFIAQPQATIEHENIASDWCFILPSMKRGRIVSISHDIPEDSPFTSYRDLKRHWKNTYGYRLPETDDHVNFYQISFGPFGGKCFTYPEMCLRPRELQRVSRVDPKPILRTFVIELQTRFPTVCGAPIQLQTKAKFTVNDLLSSTQADTNAHPNLTSKMTGSRPAVYRSKVEVEKMLTQQKVTVPSVPSFVQQSATRSGTSIANTVIKEPSISDGHRRDSIVAGVSNRTNNGSGNSCVGQNNGGQEVNDCKTSENQLPESSSVFSQKQVVLLSQTSCADVTSRPLGLVSGQTVSRGFGGPISATPFSQPAQSTTAAHHGPAGDTDSSLGSLVPGTQQPVSRKLFPTFRPKKTPVQIAAPVIAKTTPKVVPMFSAQKKQSYGSSWTPHSRTNEHPNRPFCMLMGSASSQNVAQGSSALDAFNKRPKTSPFKFSTTHSTQSSQNSLIPASFQKATPMFQKAAPSFKKAVSNSGKPNAGGLTGSTAKKSQGCKSKTQEGKGEKSKKRQKEGKKSQPAESKKAKKLKKAEA